MRVPGIGIHGRAEPVPADNGNAEHGENHAPHGEAADFTGNGCAAEVGHGGNPDEDDSPQGYLGRLKFPFHQLGKIAYCSDGDSDVGDYQGNGIGIVGNKVAGFTEGILGITAHTTGVFTEAAALGERICQSQRTACGNQP